MSTAPARCGEHPDRTADFQCDGCREPLCGECVEEGRSLLFCRRCGERALPLDPATGATSRELRQTRERAALATYRYRDGLGYPFRGLGGTAFWGYVGALWILTLVGSLLADFLPLANLPVVLLQALLLLFLPALLITVAYTTVRGDDELPDWPDLTFGEIFGAILRTLLVVGVAALPLLFFLEALDCPLGALVTGAGHLGACLLALVLGTLFGALVGLPAFGAAAVYGSAWLAPRLDLHFQAARRDWDEFLTACLLTAAVLLLGGAVPIALARTPLPGWLTALLGDAAALYGAVVAAHLAGVYFRRHSRELYEVYMLERTH